MDIRRELDLINKQFDWFHKTQGMVIVWYEFLPLTVGNSTFDDVYDEGIVGSNGRKYKQGVKLPVLRITEIEDQKRAIPDARLPIQNIEMFITSKTMRDAGISNPWEYENHLNDIFKWDGRVYTVVDYKVRGNLRGDVYHLVQGSQLYVDQEMVNDPGPYDDLDTELPWPTNLPILG
jgi:hypothetical protein